MLGLGRHRARPCCGRSSRTARRVVAVDDRPTRRRPRPGRRARRRAGRGARRRRRCAALVGRGRGGGAEPRRARPPPGLRRWPRRPACRCCPSSTWPPAGTTGPSSPSPAPTARPRSPSSSRAMLEASGRRAVAVRQHRGARSSRPSTTPTVEVFVVEASSFRLLPLAPLRARRRHLAQLRARPPRRPRHASRRYVAAKARIWADQAPDQVAIGNADDPVVARRRSAGAGAGTSPSASAPTPTTALDGDRLVLDDGDDARSRSTSSHRAFPHDLANALAAAATRRARRRRRSTAPATALARLPGPPPPGDAGGRGWGRALVRRLEGHHAPCHPCRAARPSTRSCSSPAAATRASTSRELAEDADHVRAVVAIGEAARRGGGRLRRAPPGAHGRVDGRGRRRGGRAGPRRATPCCCRPACASFDWYGPTASGATTSCAPSRELLAGAARR